jgi:hypothetical protein
MERAQLIESVYQQRLSAANRTGLWVHSFDYRFDLTALFLAYSLHL